MAEVPFDSERKRMTTVHRVNGKTGEQESADSEHLRLPVSPSPFVAFIKGAPDLLLEEAVSRVMTGEGKPPLDGTWREAILAANNVAEALRVLGIAYRPLDAPPGNPDAEALEQELTFVGLMGMINRNHAGGEVSSKSGQWSRL